MIGDSFPAPIRPLIARPAFTIVPLSVRRLSVGGWSPAPRGNRGAIAGYDEVSCLLPATVPTRRIAARAKEGVNSFGALTAYLDWR